MKYVYLFIIVSIINTTVWILLSWLGFLFKFSTDTFTWLSVIKQGCLFGIAMGAVLTFLEIKKKKNE